MCTTNRAFIEISRMKKIRKCANKMAHTVTSIDHFWSLVYLFSVRLYPYVDWQFRMWWLRDTIDVKRNCPPLSLSVATFQSLKRHDRVAMSRVAWRRAGPEGSESHSIFVVVRRVTKREGGKKRVSSECGDGSFFVGGKVNLSQIFFVPLLF